jgi:hypothetical protein
MGHPSTQWCNLIIQVYVCTKNITMFYTKFWKLNNRGCLLKILQTLIFIFHVHLSSTRGKQISWECSFKMFAISSGLHFTVLTCDKVAYSLLILQYFDLGCYDIHLLFRISLQYVFIEHTYIPVYTSINTIRNVRMQQSSNLQSIASDWYSFKGVTN